MLKLTLPTTDKDYTIVRNINDTLLWYRVSDGIYKIINAARSGEYHDFDADSYYHGLSVSFFLLGINNDDNLSNALDEIFWKHKKATDDILENQQSSWDTATTIYGEWVAYLKEFALSNLKPVA